MHQALTRRYSRIKAGEGKLPDVLLVDGGKGQMSMARDVLNELQVRTLSCSASPRAPHARPVSRRCTSMTPPTSSRCPGDSPAAAPYSADTR
ncbi:excinuclease ABC subunit C, partial [Pseudomonas syringae pv. actinidiae]|nr:excinuclease ABC subunit C [Pseudomonas syringae pv. actinidiae]